MDATTVLALDRYVDNPCDGYGVLVFVGQDLVPRQRLGYSRGPLVHLSRRALDWVGFRRRNLRRGNEPGDVPGHRRTSHATRVATRPASSHVKRSDIPTETNRVVSSWTREPSSRWFRAVRIERTRETPRNPVASTCPTRLGRSGSRVAGRRGMGTPRRSGCRRSRDLRARCRVRPQVGARGILFGPCGCISATGFIVDSLAVRAYPLATLATFDWRDHATVGRIAPGTARARVGSYDEGSTQATELPPTQSPDAVARPCTKNGPLSLREELQSACAHSPKWHQGLHRDRQEDFFLPDRRGGTGARHLSSARSVHRVLPVATSAFMATSCLVDGCRVVVTLRLRISSRSVLLLSRPRAFTRCVVHCQLAKDNACVCLRHCLHIPQLLAYGSMDVLSARDRNTGARLCVLVSKVDVDDRGSSARHRRCRDTRTSHLNRAPIGLEDVLHPNAFTIPLGFTRNSSCGSRLYPA